MSYVLSTLEAIDWKLPPEPGTTPIPKDHVRLYHQTSSENLGAIKHQGINFSHAKGIEGPKAIYASETGFYGKPHERPTVEFHVHKDRWHDPFVLGGDVKPYEIIGVHKPWHKHAHYLEKRPHQIKRTLAGMNDGLSGDEAKAVSYIKHKYG